MIRIFTLDSYDPALMKKLLGGLYAAFGIGAEHSGETRVPDEVAEPFVASKLLAALPPATAMSDDRVLFLTKRQLAPRALISGEAPTLGFTEYLGQRSIVSTHGLEPLDAENISKATRLAMQEIGHAFGLHHCLDPRCAMYPPWTRSYSAGDAHFCTYCRDKSELKIRQLKS